MARKNIFQIAAANNDMMSDSYRLVRLFEEDNLLQYGMSNCTLREFVDSACFAEWKNRGRSIDVDDYLEVLDYDTLQIEARTEVDSFLTLIELIFNFWMLAEEKLADDAVPVKYYKDFYYLKDYMIDCLSQYNHTAVFYKDEQMVLVIEDKPEATAAAEISDPKLSFAILRYNHHSLKGDIDAKKAILLAMGADLEPKRKVLHTVDKELEDMIFFSLNNLDIRHNNRKKGDKNYKEAVAKMRKTTLEKWYDELYQLILLAILELDNVKRMDEMKKLKTTIIS